MNLSDPKDCLYCTNNQTLHDLMIEIAPLSVSRLFLFKEQTYYGRCLVSYKDHVHDLNMLSDGGCGKGNTCHAEGFQSTKNKLRCLFR